MCGCVATVPIEEKETLSQYVFRDAFIINHFPANNFIEARKIITLKTNYLRLIFEQYHEPIFGLPKWSGKCLKDNKIGKIDVDGEKTYAISELFIQYNGTIGYCEEGPIVFKAHHILVYCPLYKGFCSANQSASYGQRIVVYCEGDQNVKDMTILTANELNLDKYKLCD